MVDPAKASRGVNPTITSVKTVNGAQYKVYAIHGLQSSISTWESSNSFKWLEHLSSTLVKWGGEAVNVSLIGWNTSLASTSNISTEIRSSVRYLANEITKEQQNFGFTTLGPARNPPAQQKVIFIGHSMGGILARALLGFMHSEIKQGADSKTQAYTTFMRSVEGVILLASPSGGSGLAKSKILVQGISSLSGGWSTLLHSELIAALKPSSKELPKITADFDGYCDWYSQQQKRQLKMAAFRETAKWKGIAMIVKPESAEIPASTRDKVKTKPREPIDLEGLSHTEMTNFNSMEDPRLVEIMRKVLWMQQN